MPPGSRPPSAAARVVYAGIVASTLIISGGALIMSLTLGTATTAAGVPDWMALICGFAAFVAGFQRHQRLTRPSGGPTEEWWTDNAGRVLVIWGLLELTAVAGAVVAFVTGHLSAFAALALLGLGGLGTLSPARIAAG